MAKFKIKTSKILIGFLLLTLGASLGCSKKNNNGGVGVPPIVPVNPNCVGCLPGSGNLGSAIANHVGFRTEVQLGLDFFGPLPTPSVPTFGVPIYSGPITVSGYMEVNFGQFLSCPLEPGRWDLVTILAAQSWASAQGYYTSTVDGATISRLQIQARHRVTGRIATLDIPTGFVKALGYAETSCRPGAGRYGGRLIGDVFLTGVNGIPCNELMLMGVDEVGACVY